MSPKTNCYGEAAFRYPSPDPQDYLDSSLLQFFRLTSINDFIKACQEANLVKSPFFSLVPMFFSSNTKEHLCEECGFIVQHITKDQDIL